MFRENGKCFVYKKNGEVIKLHIMQKKVFFFTLLDNEYICETTHLFSSSLTGF